MKAMGPNRTKLVDFGVVYDQKVAKDDECPAHVENLRTSILDFSYPLPRSSQSSNLQEVIENEAQKGPRHRDPMIRLAADIRNEAVRLREGAHAENQWAKFFHANFLDRLASCTLPPNGESRMYVANTLLSYLLLT